MARTTAVGAWMKVTANDPPRRFTVGQTVKFEMSDCGTVLLTPDEQVTFLTPSGAQFDVARKEWGFYATPSVNGRLAGFGLRTVLIRNQVTDRYFVLLVERGRESAFETYLVQESCEVVAWLDTTEALTKLRARLSEPDPS
jgi:hypothetical protein